ncbi:hypothetical protein Ddc_12680 [Ditylenchus destructor]|nr:hypothetical protein Ddc_12680 [Ditylenchus destructor]
MLGFKFAIFAFFAIVVLSEAANIPKAVGKADGCTPTCNCNNNYCGLCQENGLNCYCPSGSSNCECTSTSPTIFGKLAPGYHLVGTPNDGAFKVEPNFLKPDGCSDCNCSNNFCGLCQENGLTCGCDTSGHCLGNCIPFS